MKEKPFPWVGKVALVLLAAVLLACFLTPWLGGDPHHQDLAAQYRAPSKTAWLGTDQTGRDLWTRLWYGSRLSLAVGLLAAAVSLLLGFSIGLVSGARGGAADRLLMGLADLLYGLPTLVLVMLLLLYVPNSAPLWQRIGAMALVLGTISWMTLARIVRAQAMSLRRREFVEASRALGGTGVWITLKHLVPNLAGPTLVYFTLSIPSLVMAESFLSFLGIGVQPPAASWGTLLADGVASLNAVRSYWWLVLFPALVLGLTLWAIQALGDSLRDHWDVR